MKYDIVVIGGGLVGLAAALKILEKNSKIKLAVLEKESLLAAHQSSKNSGVIHSGIYYEPGSLKAKNCLSGREQLLSFCRDHKIKYELCGKIIVAQNERQLPALERLYERGLGHGLAGLKKLSAQEIKIYEPHAVGLAGIFVPQTGIVNYQEVAEAYAEEVKKFGGEILLNQKVLNITRASFGSEIQTASETFQAKLVVNCAGLYSDKIAGLNRPELEVQIVPFRGEFYKIKPAAAGLVKNLIYPVPDTRFPFLGVHLSRRIDGEVWGGPNAVLAFRREGYKFFDFKLKELAGSLLWPGFWKLVFNFWRVGAGEMYRSFSKKVFTNQLKLLVPEIEMEDLEWASSGVRAQAIGRDGKLIDDFLILDDKFQIDVLNAPSPAATASLAIGEQIAAKALAKLSP